MTNPLFYFCRPILTVWSSLHSLIFVISSTRRSSVRPGGRCQRGGSLFRNRTRSNQRRICTKAWQQLTYFSVHGSSSVLMIYLFVDIVVQSISKGSFTLSVTINTAMSLVISLWLNCLDYLINQMSHSKNRLQRQLIKYDASTDADALNQSLKLGVNRP